MKKTIDKPTLPVRASDGPINRESVSHRSSMNHLPNKTIVIMCKLFKETLENTIYLRKKEICLGIQISRAYKTRVEIN